MVTRIEAIIAALIILTGLGAIEQRRLYYINNDVFVGFAIRIN